MPSPSQHNSLINQAWLAVFLDTLGFRRIGEEAFSNGRAELRFEGNRLIAVPAGGAQVWRSDLSGASESALRYLLSQVLASSGFLSQMEIERRAAKQAAAEEALQLLATAIRENPEGHSGRELRRFLWSLYNGHHQINLWKLKDVLDSQHNAFVVEVFVAWMEGFVPYEALREALTLTGEILPTE